MTGTGIHRPIAITGCGVVSPAGVGLAGLRELMRTPSMSQVEPGSDAEAYPPLALRTLPELSLRDHVGRKGTRRLDRMVGIALIATKAALDSAGRSEERELRPRTGVSLGTSTGSIASLAEIATDTLVQDEPYMIEPSRFPNTVLNSCAGQMAIWNSLKGVNSTLAGGHVSSTSAVRYALNAIHNGHATSMLAGGIEELTPHMAWAWYKSGLLRADAALGEGCAILVLEDKAVTNGRPIMAEALGAATAYCGARGERTSLAAGIAGCIGRLLARHELRAEEIDVVSLGAGAQIGARRIEEQGVRLALGTLPTTVRVSDALGECFSASGALQAAALLARWSGADHPAERLGLVTSLGRDGSVGCLLLRRAC
ncbi:beta-ketoacyl synthase N-terminal-like domain-containing protein [Amycolatopsis sp. NPDC052450]|uniref:beta-ketoacyl synthase N-terminal-like domain-containing protein n=1 Tax=Amycolatopsis sp. NPDC052450 TaxID=3363937 RepID=UPI0037CA2263